MIERTGDGTGGWIGLHRMQLFVSRGRDAYRKLDTFVQMPPTQTRAIQKLHYLWRD